MFCFSFSFTPLLYRFYVCVNINSSSDRLLTKDNLNVIEVKTHLNKYIQEIFDSSKKVEKEKEKEKEEKTADNKAVVQSTLQEGKTQKNSHSGGSEPEKKRKKRGRPRGKKNKATHYTTKKKKLKRLPKAPAYPFSDTDLPNDSDNMDAGAEIDSLTCKHFPESNSPSQEFGLSSDSEQEDKKADEKGGCDSKTRSFTPRAQDTVRSFIASPSTPLSLTSSQDAVQIVAESPTASKLFSEELSVCDKLRNQAAQHEYESSSSSSRSEDCSSLSASHFSADLKLNLAAQEDLKKGLNVIHDLERDHNELKREHNELKREHNELKREHNFLRCLLDANSRVMNEHLNTQRERSNKLAGSVAHIRDEIKQVNDMVTQLVSGLIVNDVMI